MIFHISHFTFTFFSNSLCTFHVFRIFPHFHFIPSSSALHIHLSRFFFCLLSHFVWFIYPPFFFHTCITVICLCLPLSLSQISRPYLFPCFKTFHSSSLLRSFSLSPRSRSRLTRFSLSPNPFLLSFDSRILFRS